MTSADRPDAPVLSILHVVDSLERGGLERVVCDLAVEQMRASHRVGVFSINATDGFLGELEASGVPVAIGGKTKPFDLEVIRALRRAALRPRVDVVHAHNFTPNYYTAAALLGARRPPVHVLTCHDMATRLGDRRLRLFYTGSLLRTRRAAMVSRQVHEHYVGSGLVPERRAEAILNGIPVDRFAPSPERRRAARAALGLPEDATVVGCVGRLAPIKNHALLLDAVAPLIASRAPIEIVLIGGGELDGDLRERARTLGIADRVHFAGERPGVADLLPALDVFVLPSRSEGLSIALLEASASGLAIVATDVGGNREIVVDGQSGLLVPSADIAAMRAALDALLADADRRAALGAEARRFAIEHASIRAMREQYDAFYRRALAER